MEPNLDYETLCKIVGKLFIDSQSALLNQNIKFGELYIQHTVAERRCQELEKQISELRLMINNLEKENESLGKGTSC